MNTLTKYTCLGLLALATATATPTARAQQETTKQEKEILDQKLRALDALKAEEDALAARRAFVAAAQRPTPTAQMEKVPYCGVSTEEVPAALTAQLKLTRGMGLLVNFVEPKSPAEMAGVKQYDVLLKFNDQLLTNPEQLRALVRMKMPSDDVKFALIRQGQPTDVNVELGQKEMQVEAEAIVAPGMPTPAYGLYKVNGGNVMIDGGAFNGAVGGGGGGIAFTNVTTNGRNQMVWRDGQYTLNLELKDGKAVSLTAKDRAGNEIFNGPVETDDQRKALPADLADKLQNAEAHAPMRGRGGFGGGGGGGVGGGFGGIAVGAPPRGRALDTRATRVFTSTEDDTLMVARFDKDKAAYVFAFSTADGKTLFDGPTATDEQRKALPDAVAKQLDTLEKNQAAAAEFGQIGRN